MTHAFRDDVTVGHRLFRRVSVVKEALEEGRFLRFFCTACIDLSTRLIDTSTDELEFQLAKHLHVEIKPLLPRPLSYRSHIAASTDCWEYGRPASTPMTELNCAARGCQKDAMNCNKSRTKIPRFGKSFIAVERGSSAPKVHFPTAPRR